MARRRKGCQSAFTLVVNGQAREVRFLEAYNGHMVYEAGMQVVAVECDNDLEVVRSRAARELAEQIRSEA